LAHHVAAIARHLDAAVHAAVFIPDFPEVSSLFGDLLVDVPTMTRETKAKCQTRSRALLAAFEAELGRSGGGLQRSETHCLPEQVGGVVAERARYHDAAMIGIGEDAGSRAVAEAAIFGAGRATVLVPEGAAPRPLDRLFVAWDGSRFAARAVADAAEFIRRASAVTIATLVGEKPLPGERLGDRLADYLAARNVKTDVLELRGGGDVAATLQDRALDTGAGLMVMGAFGHSRLREFVLGGATAGVLRDLRLPALLSH
jgi:nucleotide-binding universal stress UspA family protein